MIGLSTIKTNRIISHDSLIHRRLQGFVANMLFPVGKGDWYQSKGYGSEQKTSFADFVETQKNDDSAQYHKAFQGLKLSQQMVNSKLVDGSSCALEVCTSELEKSDPAKPGTGKHIVYFPGANTYYQACFRDIAAASKQTGASVHAFNFPGTGRSTGKVTEANDLINAGMAVVKSLLEQGIHPDDIVLQGDCYGAAIALEVKKQFEGQAGIKVRVVMNNAFKSFKAAVCDLITESPWIPRVLKSIVKRLLEFTGWHISPGKKYVQADPYQCHIQHLGDHTLESSTLSDKVSRYQAEIRTGMTKSKKRGPVIDPCPDEYKKDRAELDQKHYVRVREDAKERLGNKFGRDKYGRINAHFADICELEMLNGESVYESFINDYLIRSDKYIKAHPQVSTNGANVGFLAQISTIEVTPEDVDNFNTVVSLLNEEKAQLQQTRSLSR